MKVLFVDMVARKPYTANTLRSYAMGGTEATVLRVARGLAKEGLSVFLFEGCDPHRTEMSIDGIFHCNELTQFGEPDAVVHLRTLFFVAGFREMYPNARHIVWLHDIVTEVEDMGDVDTLVCVSEWHLSQALGFVDGCPDMRRIYNPVVVGEAKRLPKVPGRLGFFSSPHKGLDQVRKVFADYLSGGRAPDAPVPSLVIANPGYLPDSGASDSGVINLGQLPHHRVLEEMSKCEALFYPQTVFPETFGLVLAEANAMGTPVLAHDFGAAREVLISKGNAMKNFVVDCAVPGNVAVALLNLPSARGAIADPRFALDTVVAEWRTLLGGA